MRRTVLLPFKHFRQARRTRFSPTGVSSPSAALSSGATGSSRLHAFPLLAMLLSICLAQGIAFGQGPAHRKREFFFDSKGTSFTLDREKPLVVRIEGIGEKDVVCLQTPNPETAKEGIPADRLTVKAWAVLYNDQAGTAMDLVRVSNIVPLTEEVRFLDGTLSIKADGSANRRVVVFAVVPPNTQTTVFVNGKLVGSGPQAPNITVRDRGVVAYSANLESTSVLMGALVGVQSATNRGFQNGAALPKSPYRVESIDWKLLRNQLIEPVSAPLLPSETKGIDSRKKGWAAMEVVVGNDGNVLATSFFAGDEELANAAAAVLKGTRFRPYLQDNQAVTVRSIIPVIHRQGNIVFFTDDEGKN